MEGIAPVRICILGAVPGRPPKFCQRSNHGMYQTPTYRSWRGVISRCNDKTHHQYHHYGARGIKVCDAWLTFVGFFRDMGERPEGMTIDRINNDGNYEPGNCRWATKSEQRRNSRQRINWLTHQGVTLPLLEWSEILGIRPNKIRYRLSHGWAVDRALSPCLYNNHGELQCV